MGFPGGSLSRSCQAGPGVAVPIRKASTSPSTPLLLRILPLAYKKTLVKCPHGGGLPPSLVVTHIIHLQTALGAMWLYLNHFSAQIFRRGVPREDAQVHRPRLRVFLGFQAFDPWFLALSCKLSGWKWRKMVFQDGEPLLPRKHRSRLASLSPLWQPNVAHPTRVLCLSLQIHGFIPPHTFSTLFPNSTHTRHSNHTVHTRRTVLAWPRRPGHLLLLPSTAKQQSRRPPRPPQPTMSSPIHTIALRTWPWGRRLRQ